MLCTATKTRCTIKTSAAYTAFKGSEIVVTLGVLHELPATAVHFCYADTTKVSC